MGFPYVIHDTQGVAQAGAATKETAQKLAAAIGGTVHENSLLAENGTLIVNGQNGVTFEGEPFHQFLRRCLKPYLSNGAGKVGYVTLKITYAAPPPNYKETLPSSYKDFDK